MYWFIYVKTIESLILAIIGIKFLYSAVKSKIPSLNLLAITFLLLSGAFTFEVLGHLCQNVYLAQLLFRAYLALIIAPLIPFMAFFEYIVGEQYKLRLLFFKILCIVIIALRLTIVTFEVYSDHIITRTPARLLVDDVDLDLILVTIALIWFLAFVIQAIFKQLRITRKRGRRIFIELELLGVALIVIPLSVIYLLAFSKMITKDILIYATPLSIVAGALVLVIPYLADPYITLIVPQRFYGLILATKDGSIIEEIYLDMKIKSIYPIISGLIMALNRVGGEVIEEFGEIEEIRFKLFSIIARTTTNFVFLLFAKRIVPLYRESLKNICKEVEKLEKSETDTRKLLLEIRKISYDYVSILLP